MSPTIQAEELISYIFDEKPHSFTEEIGMWLGSSRRFTAFVFTFRDKIRKKLRVTHEKETLYDLRLELETAYLLLQEKTLSLVYEPEQSKQVRSPDFAVTYTTSLTFMVEVTRLRGVPSSESSTFLNSERFSDALCTKLGQFLPQRGNVLIIAVDASRLTQSDLQSIMLRVQQRAERNNSVFWQRYGFQDRADFFRHYQRLSEILVRNSQLQSGEPLITWNNSQAKHPLPSKVRTALYRSHTV